MEQITPNQQTTKNIKNIKNIKNGKERVPFTREYLGHNGQTKTYTAYYTRSIRIDDDLKEKLYLLNPEDITFIHKVLDNINYYKNINIDN